jgi:fatty acid desaturase
LIGNICGFLIILPHQQFRHEHCDHHTYTQHKGQDPELIELPKSLWMIQTRVSDGFYRFITDQHLCDKGLRLIDTPIY